MTWSPSRWCRPPARRAAPPPRAARRATVLPAALLALGATAVGAQAPATAALDGVVRDSAGRALPSALVSADATDRTALSDSAGVFRLVGLPPGPRAFSVRRIGYTPTAFEIDLPPEATVHLAVTLRPAVPRLATVVVNGELRDAALQDVGFYGRRALATARFGSGRFLDAAALAPWRGSAVSVALRGVPDVRVDGPAGRARAAFRDAQARLGCAPEVWIDGDHSPTPFAALDGLLPVDQVRAVEVYPWPRTVPLQFRRARTVPTCGALVIWTARLGAP